MTAGVVQWLGRFSRVLCAHWGHDYHLDGRLERSENGRTRSGSWSAQNNQLCLLLPEVSKVSPVCFDVVRVGEELQYRDAGSVVYQGSVRKGPRS